MLLKTPHFLRASLALALLTTFPDGAVSGPTEIKINTPVGEGLKPVGVRTGNLDGPVGSGQTAVPTLNGGVLPALDAPLVEPGIGAPAEAARVAAQNTASVLPAGASPVDAAAPAGVPRAQVRVVPAAAVPRARKTPDSGKTPDAAAPRIGDKNFQKGLRRVQNGADEIGAALSGESGRTGDGVLEAAVVGGRLFDAMSGRRRINFADDPSSGAQKRRGPPRRSLLERPEPSQEAWLRAYVQKRIPEAEESGKEGVPFNSDAVEKRIFELTQLDRRMEEILHGRFRLERTEARDLWREILKEHPTVFGYHIPEHSHQPLMVTQQVLDRIESLGPDKPKTAAANLREWRETAAAYEDFNRKPMPQKYDRDRSAPKIPKAEQLRYLEERYEQSQGSPQYERMWKALAELKFERLQLLTRRTQAEVMKTLLDVKITREDRAILDIATILHDVDPTREEGTLARVAETLRWLDTPRGEEILGRLAGGHFPNADAAALAKIKRKVRAYIMATDFQYESAKKDAIWPAFLFEAAIAWDIDVKKAWKVSRPMDIPADDAFPEGDPTARKVLALAHLLRISDQFGAYTIAASLTPEDADESFRFTEWMVRMLKREMRRTPFVPDFLRGLPADGLLAGTFNFLTQREPGSPTFDDKVEGAAKPLSVAGITDQVLNTARNFRSAYAPDKFKPADFWASPEDAENFLLSELKNLPAWFEIGRRPQETGRARVYDDFISAFLMTRPDGLYGAKRAKIIDALAEAGTEIDWDGAPPERSSENAAPTPGGDASGRRDASRSSSRTAIESKEARIGRAIAAARRYTASIAGGLSLRDEQRYALMEMSLEEQGIRLDSEIGRAVEAELFPDRAKRAKAARAAINAQFSNHADLIVELAAQFGKTTPEVEAIVRSRPALANLLSGKTDPEQARTQLVFALQRERVETMTARYPDNRQGRFLRALGREISTPGGKSIEEIVRAGAFAYVSFRGRAVGDVSVGRDPDVQSSDYVFYVLLEPDGRWTINGYRKNSAALRGTDGEWVRVLEQWLEAGLPGQVRFTPRRI